MKRMHACTVWGQRAVLARTIQGSYEYCIIRTGMLYQYIRVRSRSKVPVELSRSRDTVSDEIMTVCFFVWFGGFKPDSLVIFS